MPELELPDVCNVAQPLTRGFGTINKKKKDGFPDPMLSAKTGLGNYVQLSAQGNVEKDC